MGYVLVTLHPFLADFLHWRTRRTHRSTTHCRACGHTAHAVRPRSRQFLKGLRVECFKMEEQLLLLVENPFVESIFIKWREKRLGEPNFWRKREVLWVSYFVPNAAEASTLFFFQYFRMGPDTFWYFLHNIRPYIEKNKVILGNVFQTKVFLLRPCCGSSYSVHPTVVYVHTPKKSVLQYQPFSSNITKRKQGSDVLSSKLHDTQAYTAGKNKMIWFRPSVGETCACTSVQHGATETISTYLNAFVCLFCRCRPCMSV